MIYITFLNSISKLPLQTMHVTYYVNNGGYKKNSYQISKFCLEDLPVHECKQQKGPFDLLLSLS